MNIDQLLELAKINQQKVDNKIITHQTLFDDAFAHALIMKDIVSEYSVESKEHLNVISRFNHSIGWCSCIGKIVPEIEFLPYNESKNNEKSYYFMRRSSTNSRDLIDAFPNILGYLEPFHYLLDEIEEIDISYFMPYRGYPTQIQSTKKICASFIYIANKFKDVITPNDYLKNYAIIG